MSLHNVLSWPVLVPDERLLSCLLGESILHLGLVAKPPTCLTLRHLGSTIVLYQEYALQLFLMVTIIRFVSTFLLVIVSRLTFSDAPWGSSTGYEYSLPCFDWNKSLQVSSFVHTLVGFHVMEPQWDYPCLTNSSSSSYKHKCSARIQMMKLFRKLFQFLLNSTRVEPKLSSSTSTLLICKVF